MTGRTETSICYVRCALDIHNADPSTRLAKDIPAQDPRQPVEQESHEDEDLCGTSKSRGALTC